MTGDIAGTESPFSTVRGPPITDRMTSGHHRGAPATAGGHGTLCGDTFYSNGSTRPGSPRVNTGCERHQARLSLYTLECAGSRSDVAVEAWGGHVTGEGGGLFL